MKSQSSSASLKFTTPEIKVGLDAAKGDMPKAKKPAMGKEPKMPKDKKMIMPPEPKRKRMPKRKKM